MSKPKLLPDFVKLCQTVTAKRPKTVINHILKHGFITTQELKDKYGYNHPPRAVRDVKEHGIPIEMFRVEGVTGGKSLPTVSATQRRHGLADKPDALHSAKNWKQKLVALQGPRCAIYQEVFPERELQIDHRIPFEVLGDVRAATQNPEDYMLLCGSANRAKWWSCEHCVNWLELKKPEICRSCYWAYPENYTHVAMRQMRRADILWTEEAVENYEKLKQKTIRLQKNIPGYVKEIIRQHLQSEEPD